MTNKQVSVTIVYLDGSHEAVMAVSIPRAATVLQAIEKSDILAQHPQIDLMVNKVGIFGKIASLDTQIQEGDRVEIYRPLLLDPKDARRRRAKNNKSRVD